MKLKRFEDYETDKTQPSCGSCEHYYTSTCDGNKGLCSSYKKYRYYTVENLQKVNISLSVINILLFLMLSFKLLLN